MSTDLETAQAQVAFWAEVGPVIEEFENAKAGKAEDPARWKAAAQAMDGDEGLRTIYRTLAQAPVKGEIVASTIGTSVTAPGVK